MKKGEIYHINTPSPDGYYRHHFVYWDNNGTKSYIGIMITHAVPERYANNIPLMDSHFKEGFKVENESSHFVACKLIKDVPISNLELTGELTAEGIEYIESHLFSVATITWAEYKRSI